MHNLTLDIFDYAGHKLCTLFDSSSDLAGQATDVIITTERNGWKTLQFTLPYVDENGDKNFRIDFLKADFRIRAVDDKGKDEFLISEPAIKHNDCTKTVTVTAGNISQLLKTRNLGLEFSDEEGNNVGTAEELLTTILEGTGWRVGNVAEFKEKRSGDIKRRSIKASAKTGAFKLISNMCDLFEAKPIYYVRDEEDEETGKIVERRYVDIVPMNPFSEPEDGQLPEIAETNKVIELHYSKNVKNVTKTLNTDNLVTKLYCYGAFGDKISGYCGIDEWHHNEYEFQVNSLIEEGTECYFSVNNSDTSINYTRYFTAQSDITAGSTLLWSILDPTSMSYIWDGNTAHSVYEHRKTTSPTPIECTDIKVVTNQFSFLTDYSYYQNVGLLTDDMLQTVASYQRNMPGMLVDTNEKATQFAQSLNNLAETIGSVNFVKLNVDSYGMSEPYVHLVLDSDQPVLYRTDYNVKPKKQFKWRVAEKLKENGDPVNGVASVVYIIHTHTNPVTFEIVYLKGINGDEGKDVTEDDMNNPQDLTLWLQTTDFDSSHLSTDQIFLFQTHNVNGTLGALQVSDEATVQSLEKTTKVVTTKHPVYFVEMSEQLPSVAIDTTTSPPTTRFLNYGWAWKYSHLDIDSEMYFCYIDQDDIDWHRVYFQEHGPTTTPSVSGVYIYAWREAALYRYRDGAWRKLDDTPQEKRVVATFGSVFRACMSRDKWYKGYYQYYTYQTDNVLPVGNYAIMDEYGTYYVFTTEEAYDAGTYFTYDTTNRWVVPSDNPPPYDTLTVIDDALESHEYRFDNVFSNSDDVAESTMWNPGYLDVGDGTYKSDSYIIMDGGGELDGPEYENDIRSGFCGAYPYVNYIVDNFNTLGATGNVYFYTIEHGYLGHAQITDGTVFRTPANTRFMRFASTYSDDQAHSIQNITCIPEDADTSFVVDDEEYYILGEGDPSGDLKGIIHLTGKFVEQADQTYITDYQAMKDAQDAVNAEELKLIETLGDIYREGYWQKADYVDGDEDKLYYDGLENIEKIAQPETKYNVTYLDLYDANQGMEYTQKDTDGLWPDIDIDYAIHLVDPELNISQWAFIDKISKCYDHPWKTSITINTNLSTIAQHSFTDVMTHIAEVAQQVNGKMEIYERAMQFDEYGNMSTSNLQGMLDAAKTVITGGASTWYTDEQGRMMFEQADGKSAMMLSGGGWLIANSKDNSGDWEWRTAGTGDGLVADMITVGTVDADRIIQSKLMQRLDEELVLTSNESVQIMVNDGVQDASLDIYQYVNEADNRLTNDIARQVADRVSIADYEQDKNATEERFAGISVANGLIVERVSATETALGTLGTSIVVDPVNGLTLRQDQDAEHQAVLTSNELRFEEVNGDVRASFGVDGGYVDRLRSNERLSVGTETDGWYDMVMMSDGLADKWRDGTQSSVNIPLILQQPVNSIGSGAYSFTIAAAKDGVCQWQQRNKGSSDPFSDVSTGTTIQQNISTTKEYRCAVTNSVSHRTVYSRIVYAYDSRYPVIIVDLPASQAIQSGDQITLQVLASDATGYQWQQQIDSGSTYSDMNGETSRTLTASPTVNTYYRCVIAKVVDNVQNTITSTACAVTIGGV